MVGVKKWYSSGDPVSAENNISSGDPVSTESIMEWSELRNGTLVVTLSALRASWNGVS